MWSVVLAILVSFSMGWVARRFVNFIFNDFLVDALSLKTSFSGRGADVAWELVDRHNLKNVAVLKGRIDCYSPKEKAIYLSEKIECGDSVGAAAVAAHECGHAQQFEKSLFWVPMVHFGKMIDIYVILLGVLLSSTPNGKILLVVGTGMFAAHLFLEYDASSRAYRDLKDLMGPGELAIVKRVLVAAGLTYVVAVIPGISVMSYFLQHHFWAANPDMNFWAGVILWALAGTGVFFVLRGVVIGIYRILKFCFKWGWTRVKKTLGWDLESMKRRMGDD